MKRKLQLLLLTLMAVLTSGNSFAGDTYAISFNGKNAGDTDFFTWNTAKHNFNTKFNGAEYAGITFTSGLKMEGATNVGFTSTATSIVTIVQSTWSVNTIKFDGAELAVADAEAGTGCRIYTITDVEAGSHAVTRGSGESGIFYISVEYVGASLQVLNTPEITFDENTGVVTITGDSNASSIVYTIDGTTPSADNGEAYSNPFTVEDGTVVKAIAIGDGETYTNSQVASTTVLLANVVVADPVIKVVNGTFAITCETADVTLEYSTDGTTYNTYTIPVTLFEDATVYARATRGNSSADASAEVTVISKGDATETVTLTYDAFEAPATVDGLSTLVGKDDAAGYSLVLNLSGKSWSNGARLNGKESIKLSNGAENILRLPSGYAATRMTIYSYINTTATNRVNGWRSVTGVEDTKYADVPMGATSASPATVFDVRVFPLDGTESEISFTNTGDQLCFYIVLDVKPTKPVLTAAYDPASLTVIEGEEFDAPVLTVTNEEGAEVTGLTISYESSDENVATVDSDGTITIVGSGKATITANVSGGDDYADAKAKLELTVKSVLVVKENPTEVVLTKANILANGYLSVSTDNWNTGKTYGDYQGDFYNMSGTGRKLTVIETGAVAFEVLVQNSNAGRSYTVTIGDDAQTVEHNGTGIESSGLIECAEGENTIVLAGTGNSVYPVAIKFYTVLPLDVEIKSAGYATFYDSSVAYTIPEGVTAYVVENVTNKKVGLSELSGVIPADCGVILEGTPGTYRLNGSAESPEAPVNMLRGSDAEETTTGSLEGGSYKFYALSVSNDVVGFYYMAEDGAAFTNGAHKAYLALPENGTVSGNFISLFEVDGISQAVTGATAETPAYNLAGQRVGDNFRGVVIVNGKKQIRH